MQKEGYFDPTRVDRTHVSNFANAIWRRLSARDVRGKPSPALQKMVRARVRLSDINEYLSQPSLSGLLCRDVLDLGNRIRDYQYIERYRFAFEGFSREMNVAFIRHTFHTRHNEVYLIKEKTVKTLAYAAELASHLGLEAQSQTRSFTNRFDEAMNFRLRERHRTAHSHEAPSLTGRALEMGTIATASEDSEAAIQEMLKIFKPLIATLKELSPDLFAGGDEKFTENYLREVDQEAADMWSLVEAHLRISLSLPE
ncbi:hypothetical protein HFO04_01500 [Rhizobium laguerreae]|uniref:hypothetical protein n=1 Tax=Rhizobium laguerreae TaxID=1076926 RepID=UPI001C90E167|nr:hypothetical protein [Rhizobium laguerreae]MBY3301484.1 hypothetical protein [Rhizobium laguerreae]